MCSSCHLEALAWAAMHLSSLDMILRLRLGNLAHLGSLALLGNLAPLGNLACLDSLVRPDSLAATRRPRSQVQAGLSRSLNF